MLSAQVAPVEALHTFALWCRRQGWSVGEFHGWTAVAPGVHARKSPHYDRDPRTGLGLALDLNDPASGSVERASLTRAAAVGVSLGLAVTFARDGVVGSAASHRTHLHADVCTWANLGTGLTRVRGGGDLATAHLQMGSALTVDQVWGPATENKAASIRSRHAGTGRAHSEVLLMQAALNLCDDGAARLASDGVWGARTDARYLAVRDVRRRR